MNKTKDFLSAASLALAMTFTLTGCGPTQVMVEMEQPPITTEGRSLACAKRIAVVPFEYESYVRFGEELAKHATMLITNGLRGVERFTLVDNPDSADVVLTGKITLGVSENYKRYDPLTKSDVFYTKAKVGMTYSLKVVKDGKIIGPLYKRQESEDSGPGIYPNELSLQKDIVFKIMGFIHRDFFPYKSLSPRNFAKDNTGSKAIKEELEKALVLVKAKDYKTALEAYLSIYEEYKSYAAAINAAIVYEVLGNTEAALEMARQATDKDGKPVDQAYIDVLNGILERKAKASEGCE